MLQNISLEEAVKCIQERTSLMPAKDVSLYDALGCVLAEDMNASIQQPPFHRSPLDGYAVQSQDIAHAASDTPVYLTVVDCVYAGDEAKRPIKSGEAIKVTTGAMLPAGCDCVIRQEDTDYGTKIVAVYQPVKAFKNYCFCGEEYQAGTQLLAKGDYLDAAALAVLSGAGVSDNIPVYDMPSVAIVCTGSEIVSPDMKPLPPGKIYSSNGAYLQSRLFELGIKSVSLCHAADDVPGMTALLTALLEKYDCIITTGGVSVGEKDVVPDVLQQLEAEQIFWRIAMKPGTPAMFSMKNNKPILSLSGNPFAAAATFELLARPLLAVMTGNHRISPKHANGTLQNTFSKPSPGRRLIRARYADDHVWIPESHASGMLQSFYGCNCLVDIPAGSDSLQPGETVQLILL